MDTRKLEYILAIAREQSISKAAEQVYITRPALNHFLLELEEELGVKLFERVNRKLIPTYAGELYLKAARSMLSTKEQAYKLIGDIRGGTSGQLRLGVTHGIGNTMMASVFPKFHTRYPNYSIKLKEANIRDLEAMVEEGVIDFAVVGHGSIPTNLQHLTTIACEVVLVLPPNHRLASYEAPLGKPHATLDLHLLQEEPFVLMNEDTNIRAVANRHFKMEGMEPKILIECSMSTLAYQFVKEGLGPSILMEYQVNPNDGVHVFSLAPKETWYQSVAFREGTVFSKAEKCFIDLVLQFFSEASPRQIFR